MEVEGLGEEPLLLVARVVEVEPEVLVAGQQLRDRLAVDAVEEAHVAKLDSSRGRRETRSDEFHTQGPAILLRCPALRPGYTGEVCA